MGKFRLTVAAAIVAVMGVAVWASTAGAYNCRTFCLGNTCYTNCQ